jgi:glycosyltransferase involved in cell wall biosynthesis
MGRQLLGPARHGFARARAYTWEAAARRTWDIYEAALR